MKFTKEVIINPFFEEVFVTYKLQLYRHTFISKMKYLESNHFELCEGEMFLCEQVEQYMNVSSQFLAIVDTLPELNDAELIQAFIDLEKELNRPVTIPVPERAMTNHIH